MSLYFGGSGVTPSLSGLASNVVALAPGQVQILYPAGWYMVKTGRYSALQVFEPITQTWRTIGGGSQGGSVHYVKSDGVNYRLANQTGCAVGALLTNAGSGYTSAPTVTASAGGSQWRAIVGGAVNSTVTVTNNGSGYVYAPIVTFSAPPPGGIQATGYASLSAGVITITVVDQGAGYVTAPTVTLSNDPRDTTGSGAAATATLTGADTITGLLCTDHGTALTAVPTLSFSGGGGSSAAATAIMCWTITAYAVTTAGAGLSGTVCRVTGEDAFPTTASAYANPTTQANLVSTKSADIKAPLSGGGVTATGQVVYDGGIYTSVPTPLVIPNASVVTTAPVITFTMGGANDVSLMTPS